MAIETPFSLKLPIINFSIQSLKPETPQWDSLRVQVRRALEEFGCFEAVFDGIPLELRRSLLGKIQELFDLPLQTKLRNVSKKPYHGYVGQYPHMPLFESMGIDDANIHHNVESFAHILWPEGNRRFCKTIQSYSKQLSELDQIIRRMILESLGVEKYLDEQLGSTNYLLRVMKYKGPQTPEPNIGTVAHTDKHVVSILCQNQIEGLEVQAKDGQWFSVKPSPESFVVLIGDSLHAWTNGRLHSPNHRVTMRGYDARYSVGLFSVPKEGHIVKAPEELVDQDHPLLFKPFDLVEFLRYYYSHAGWTAKSALKDYCGV